MNSERIRPYIRHPERTVNKTANTGNNRSKTFDYSSIRKKKPSHNLSRRGPINSDPYKGNNLNIVV